MARSHCRICGAFIGRRPEHDCPGYRREPEADRTLTDTTFIAEARNTLPALDRYRRSLR